MATLRRGVLSAVAAVGVVVGPGGAASIGQPSISSALQWPPTIDGQAPVHGVIRAPGGPYLYDQAGRVVFFHGVNAVYKHPPYELYPAPGKPWNFTAADASLMARLGFNVVRLGMTWQGLEPGTAPANDPAICAPGAPRNPRQLDQAVLNRYLSRLTQTVDLLGRYHIYTILDMHQDVYNQMFDGEGAPNWAVCTDGEPIVDLPGRWSRNYGTAAVGRAFHNFWTNDVVGDLQGQFDDVWAAVARHFRGNPWVLGYDPFNEPFSTSLVTSGDEEFDAQLECFYTGRAFIGAPLHGAPKITCPPGDPAEGVIPRILAADPHHLIFDEPDIFASRGAPNFVGPMNFPNLVFNVHVYCGHRSPVTGNPTDIAACAAQEAHALASRAEDRTEMGSRAQPGGPAWFVSEFGATSSTALLDQITASEDGSQVGWTYWAWKYYGDPTGSLDEGLVMADGKLRPTVSALARAYPEAVAGRPVSFSFDPADGTFRLVYVPDHAVRAPTVIFVPTQIHYPHGYCARVSGGRVASPANRELLEVVNGASGHAVRVTVTAGTCSRGGGRGRGAPARGKPAPKPTTTVATATVGKPRMTGSLR